MINFEQLFPFFIGWDETNPLDNSIVSQFPSNERAQRSVQASAWALEHDDNEGRHSFGIGDTAARDAITSWTSGAIWVNTSAGIGSTVLQTVVTVTASPGWDAVGGRFTSADEVKLDAIISAAAVTTAEADAGTEVGIRAWSPILVKTAVSAHVPDPVSQASAEAGTGTNERMWTSLRVGQAIAAQVINSGDVGQAALKTTTASFTNAAAADQLTAGAGGEYTFWPTVKHNDFSARNREVHVLDGNVALTQTFAQYFVTTLDVGTMTVQYRYVQASPPYDLGDGEIPTFIFAMIENVSGNIKSVWMAADPPWANNGPTNIRPDFVRDGVPFVIEKIIDESKTLLNPLRIIETEREVTLDYKNTDMPLIPHPFFGNDLVNNSVVLIDTFSPLVERLFEEQQIGGDPLILFHDGDIVVGNTALPARAKPAGVDIHPITLR